MQEGMIFAIHRFALNDGPGIRTTVFLKSCPLNCAWCHNPESISGKPEIAFFDEHCTLCGSCAEVCPHKAHSFIDGLHIFNHELCEACGQCVEVCPSDALRKTGYMISPDELIHEIQKDIPYFRESGGGLTLSGGEPLAQPEFTLDILRKARADGIHTCLDTCGLAPTSLFMKTLPLVNLYFFDYKHHDPDLHKAYTGVGNALILRNLDFLISHDASVHLRCPVIPGINDTDEHLQSILDLKKKYPSFRGITLLPYHNAARSKNHRYGYSLRFAEPNVPVGSLVEKWQAIIDGA